MGRSGLGAAVLAQVQSSCPQCMDSAQLVLLSVTSGRTAPLE